MIKARIRSCKSVVLFLPPFYFVFDISIEHPSVGLASLAQL